MAKQSDELTVLTALHEGKVILYPTEAVFGLGCDPDNQQAVESLLSIKQRPVEKGLILIAANYSQLLPYIDDDKIPMARRAEIFSAWPGAITWVLPAKKQTPKWLTGQFDTIAVRVTEHQQVKKLCLDFGKPLVSTSANLSGSDPVPSIASAREVFSQHELFYVEGELGSQKRPSQIKDAITGKVLRG